MRFLYSLLLYSLIPLAVTRLLWRSLRNRGYRRRWVERFGFVARLDRPASARGDATADRAGVVRPLIWVHAVSVGEVRAAQPLVQALQRDYPGHRVLVTTMTPTGSATVAELFGESVAHCYAPYDLPTAVWRFLNRTRPRLAVVMETEFWPNLFHQCGRRGIPLVLANVRMSEQSALGYRRFRRLTRATLRQVRAVGAQSEADAARMRELGAARVEVTGSIKFELQVPADLPGRAEALRDGFGARPVWVAGSTREGEEEMVLDAFAALRARFPALLLVLVPRHPERFETVARLCTGRGYRIERRSTRRDGAAPETEVLLGDTMGELLLLYAAADVAFVGGSLVPLGGQNLLEACAVGTPVVFGPHMHNFSDISRLALERGAGVMVADAPGLAAALGALLADPPARRTAAAAARRLVEDNRGALERTRALIHEVAPPPAGPV